MAVQNYKRMKHGTSLVISFVVIILCIKTSLAYVDKMPLITQFLVSPRNHFYPSLLCDHTFILY